MNIKKITMKQFLGLFLFVVFVSLAGCRTKQIAITETTTTSVRQRIQPIALPMDTALLSFSLELDSLENLTIRDYKCISTSGIDVSVKQELNSFQILFKNTQDTIFTTVTDSVIIKHVPVVQQKTPFKRENRLFYTFKWISGLILLIIILNLLKTLK